MLIEIERTDGGISLMRLTPTALAQDDGVLPILAIIDAGGETRFAVPTRDAKGRPAVGYLASPNALSPPAGTAFVYPDPAAEVARWERDDMRAAAWREIAPAAVPADRTFREAWERGPVVNMVKARAIHLGRIRSARDAKLRALDIAFSKALGQKDQAAADAAEAERQALRDLPAAVDLSRAATPDELRALWPAELSP